jgi:hypothetical protein
MSRKEANRKKNEKKTEWEESKKKRKTITKDNNG